MKDYFKFFRVLGMLIIATVLFAVLHQATQAQVTAGSQAFGAIGKGGNNGMQAQVWTAQQPSEPANWRASPVAVCTTYPPCNVSGYFIETGYVKGINTPVPNVLQQYASWTSPNPGQSGVDYALGNLNDNTWYTFIVRSNLSSNLWLIRRNGVQVDAISASNIGYTNGRMVNCGGEAGSPGTYIAVQCNSMQYFYQGTWTLFDWNYAQTTSGSYNYCVDRPGQYAALGWGPC